MKFFQMVCVGFAFFGMTACDEEEVLTERKADNSAFVRNYNTYISKWLKEEQAKHTKQLKTLEAKLTEATDSSAQAEVQAEVLAAQKNLKKIQYRLSFGEFISYKTTADLPQDLVWQDGMENPEIGDPKAKKGGTLHNFLSKFPPTLRPVGPNSNHSARGEIYDNIEMGLVGLHPITQKFYPALASKWAISKDKQTVYYQLDKEATYSDGEPVRAEDFICGLKIRLSDSIFAPFQKQYYKEQIANVSVYSDRLLSISLPVAKLDLPYFAQVPAAQMKFYKEYGPDYKERYQWRVPPTTGAYTLLPENIKKGKSFKLTRVKNWWAKNRKFYQYTNNVDAIDYQVIGDVSKAFELFKLGKIDWFSLGSPEYWYDKMEMKEYFNGYITKSQFYNIYPRIPRGLFLNVAKAPLDNLNIRLGLHYAMDFKTINSVVYRGDFQRLEQFSDGFSEFTNPEIKARTYSIEKAEQYFAKAGYDRRDPDGYLIDSAGKRLKIEITYTEYPAAKKVMIKLKEGAKKAGLELSLDGQQGNLAFKKMVEKRHQVAYSGWGVGPPFPRYFQFFHSSNARDKEGNLKKQTNNLNSYENERVDELCNIVRNAISREQLREASYELQKIIHDDAIFVPALKVPYTRIGYWSWLKWPNTKRYEFSNPRSYTPVESYLYWIDEDEKKAILDAKKQGKALAEKNYIFDLYKKGIPSEEAFETRQLKQLK